MIGPKIEAKTVMRSISRMGLNVINKQKIGKIPLNVRTVEKRYIFPSLILVSPWRSIRLLWFSYLLSISWDNIFYIVEITSDIVR